MNYLIEGLLLGQGKGVVDAIAGSDVVELLGREGVLGWMLDPLLGAVAAGGPGLSDQIGVKPAGVASDDYRVVFVSGQPLGAE